MEVSFKQQSNNILSNLRPFRQLARATLLLLLLLLRWKNGPNDTRRQEADFIKIAPMLFIFTISLYHSKPENMIYS